MANCQTEPIKRRKGLTLSSIPIGLTCVCVYIACFAFPIRWNIPLYILFGGSLLSCFSRPSIRGFELLNLSVGLIAAFFIATALSILFSSDIERSLRLSAPFLPALLLYVMIATEFTELKHIRFLYIAFSASALLIALISLLVALENYSSYPWPVHKMHSLINWSPVLISKNDLSYLSIIAPLSLAIYLDKPRSLSGIIAIISIGLSIIAIIIYQSRGATLSMLAGLLAATLVIKPRSGIAVLTIFAALFFIIDAFFGFSLSERFAELNINRNWNRAWEIFLNNPFLGSGPNTYGLFDRTPWTHNLYLEILAERGIIGFISFLSVIFYHLLLSLKSKYNEISKIYLSGIFGSSAGFLLSSVSGARQS